VAFAISIWLGWRHGARSPINPWRAATLEWAMPVPPPSYNFLTVPTVSSRDPLWDEPELAASLAEGRGFLPGAASGRREMMGTSLRGGAPRIVVEVSTSTWIAFAAAVVLFATLVAFFAKAYWLVAVG